MFNITNNILKNDFFYDGNLILKYEINYPQITNIMSCSVKKFNNYNIEIALNLKKYIENNLLQDAKNLYEYNKANNYPIMVYEIIYDYSITYNSNNVISLYSDQYIFSGGAHGLTTRNSQNWNMQCGKQIALKDLFKNQPYFIINILEAINSQIETDPSSYFENYCNLVLNTFNPKQYFITSDSNIGIYFQQYDIAPYSSGIPVFYIDFK